MSRYRGEQPGSRRPWPFLGLLLVTFILGHDALMALEATTPTPKATAALHHAAPLAHPNTAPASGGPSPEPTHPKQCGVGLSALLRSGTDGAGIGQALPPVDRITASSASALGCVGAFVWEEPQWPPGRLRALLQVYRI